MKTIDNRQVRNVGPRSAVAGRVNIHSVDAGEKRKIAKRFSKDLPLQQILAHSASRPKL